MAKSHFKIVRVVSGRDFDCARAEIFIDVAVGEQRNFAIDERQNYRLADKIFVAVVVGVNCNARIAEHRFGTRRRHFNIARAVRERIAQVPQMTLLRLVLNLNVA